VSETQRETPKTRGEATRERILEAAELVFARRGLQGARIREIAEAAGVNGATIYTYYRSKPLLYEAVLERGVLPLQELLANYTASRGASEAEQLLGATIEHLAARPQLSRLIYLEAISEGSYLPELARRWLRPLLERAVGELELGSESTQWEESLFPLMATAFVHLSFGYFALAPLLREVFAGDPLSEEWVARQKRFLIALTRQMFPEMSNQGEGGPPPSDRSG
jgi:TetR/AcrR family transcriptional regulator